MHYNILVKIGPDGPKSMEGAISKKVAAKVEVVSSEFFFTLFGSKALNTSANRASDALQSCCADVLYL